MIARIWHGWTTPENADKYEDLLTNEIIPMIAAKKMEGYRSIQVLRSKHEDEVEFITIMHFDSLELIKQFVGEDYETAHVPEAAQAVMKRWDARSEHYEIRGIFEYQV